MKISFTAAALPEEGAVAVAVFEGKQLSPAAKELDDRSGGTLSRALAADRFSGKAGQSLLVLAPAGLKLDRVVLLGVGKEDAVDDAALRGFGGAAVATVQSSGETTLNLLVKDFSAAQVAQIAVGGMLRSYRFDRYFTQMKKDEKPSLKKLVLACADVSAAKHAFAPLEAAGEGVFLTRDLVSEPANVATPDAMVEAAKALEKLGVTVEVLNEKHMRKLGMGALLGVGQGSDQPSYLVVMRWQGAKDKDAAPLALVGKGVCFDTGGISIKPAAGMEEMKYDMAGAGAVIGAMKALAGRKAQANVVGVVGLVENMPSGTAQRPGDVVTSMSGQTIEVINTDAEGRLVLADALWYTKETFKPAAMVDLATLTGAMVIALGNEYGGLFSNDDDLAKALTAAGDTVGEPLWRLPMGEAYDKQIKSDIADMKNVGGREGGSITAAQFLKRFVGETPWAHLDIAGMAWTKKDLPVCPKGATAYGVRLLDRLVADVYED